MKKNSIFILMPIILLCSLIFAAINKNNSDEQDKSSAEITINQDKNPDEQNIADETTADTETIPDNNDEEVKSKYDNSNYSQEEIQAMIDKVSNPDYSELDNDENNSSQFEYSENSDGTLTISNYTGEEKTVAVPQTINGKTVTAIGDNAFNGYTDEQANKKADIIAISIPDTIKTIGIQAFSNCFSLVYIKLSENIEIIPEAAFACCYQLDNISIPDSVTEINNKAFYRCSAISSLNFSTDINSIGSYAFYGCDSLTEINIPDSVKSIGIAAFACSDRLETAIIGNGISEIPNYLFFDCDLLKNTLIPDNVISIGEGAYSWTSIAEIKLPDGLKSIQNGAFFSCSYLTEITIPENVESIGKDSLGYTEDGERNIIKLENGLVIKGSDSSPAEKYASDNGITFESLNK